MTIPFKKVQGLLAAQTLGSEWLDASLLVSKMACAPFTEERLCEEPSQIFRVSFQIGQGRRVMERLHVALLCRTKLETIEVYSLAAIMFMAHGYTGITLRPIVVEAGDAIVVKTSLTRASKWWQRLVDGFWDWWRPPLVRVLVSGVKKVKAAATMEDR